MFINKVRSVTSHGFFLSLRSMRSHLYILLIVFDCTMNTGNTVSDRFYWSVQKSEHTQYTHSSRKVNTRQTAQRRKHVPLSVLDLSCLCIVSCLSCSRSCPCVSSEGHVHTSTLLGESHVQYEHIHAAVSVSCRLESESNPRSRPQELLILIWFKLWKKKKE